MRERMSARRSCLVATSVVALFTVGCGRGMSPVRGIVTLDDGTPLTKGLVVFEGQADGKPVMARGEIKPDGTYQLGTVKSGDGAWPGKYRVVVNPMDFSDLPDEQKNIPFDYKYMKYETSGLEFEVKSGANDFPIKLDRSRRRR